MIEPIVTKFPIFDRRYDFDTEELTSLELVGRVAQKVNELVTADNNLDSRLGKKEDTSHITNNRKLSSNGDFTGMLMGRQVSLVVAQIDSSKDKLTYITNQFADGQTGLVIDGGFFENEAIQKNYNGGTF